MESGGLYANLAAEVSGGSGVQGNGSGCGLAGVWLLVTRFCVQQRSQGVPVYAPVIATHFPKVSR